VWSTVWSRRVKHDRARCIVGSAGGTRLSGTGSRLRFPGARNARRGTGRPRRARNARLVLTAKRVIRRRGHEHVVLTQCATIDDYAPKPQFPRISPFPAVRARAARGRAAARGRRRRSVHGFTMSLSSNFTPITVNATLCMLGSVPSPHAVRCAVAGCRLPLALLRGASLL